MTDQLPEVTYEAIHTDAPDELARPFTVHHEEASTNFYWSSKGGYNLQTTLRGNPTDAEIQAHLAAVVMGVRTVIKLGGAPKGGQPAQAPASVTAPPNGAAPAPTAPAPTVPAQAGPLTLIAIRMETTPKDGKVEVKFYDNDPGHKFPALTGTKTAEAWAMLLSGCGPWTPAHFASAVSYRPSQAYRITYHLSEKLNSKGNPYKDIDRIDLA